MGMFGQLQCTSQPVHLPVAVGGVRLNMSTSCPGEPYAQRVMLDSCMQNGTTSYRYVCGAISESEYAVTHYNSTDCTGDVLAPSIRFPVPCSVQLLSL
jgi:hypothetical protein